MIGRCLPEAAVFLIAAATSCCAAQQHILDLWTNYQTIMWVGDNAYKNKDKIPLFFQRLKEMGITAVTVQRWEEPDIVIK